MKHLSCTLLVIAALTACVGPNLKVEPVTVKPIHLTIDVNLHDHDAANTASAKRTSR